MSICSGKCLTQVDMKSKIRTRVGSMFIKHSSYTGLIIIKFYM